MTRPVLLAVVTDDLVPPRPTSYEVRFCPHWIVRDHATWCRVGVDPGRRYSDPLSAPVIEGGDHTGVVSRTQCCTPVVEARGLDAPAERGSG